MIKRSPLVLSMLAAVLCLAALPAAGQSQSAPAGLEQSFLAPPDAARPWAYWWWIKGNVDEASITRDLEAMKRQGFAGLLMFDARGYHEDHLPPPPARTEFMDAEWRRLLRFAMGEAARLGLQMSVNLSSCAGALRGPWDVGDDAPKKLLYASVPLSGGKRFAGELPRIENPKPVSSEIALFAVRHEKTGDSSRTLEVVDLTGKVADGRLAWDVPPGDWTLLRFASAILEGKEVDVDILDAGAVARYFDRMGRALITDAGPLAGKTLTHFYSVSWEGAVPSWTQGLEQYFERSRGYALRPWMPALAGLTVKSPELTARFLRDYNRTLSECFMEHCYGTLQDLSRKAGLKWHSESGGPWERKIPYFQYADQLAFLGRNDMPQGEFWLPWRGFTSPVAMAAHIYGRPLAAAEAFTNMRHHWDDYPALLKPLADAAFCDGINHLIWHTFTASPPEFGKPGIEYFAGSHLNPNVTWFEQSGAFLQYLARCQLLLRRGLPVVDVCVYTGDRPYMHWDPGRKWNSKPTLTLPEGYAYDVINTEVLLDRLQVKDGRLVLPDGMSYQVLALDLEDETAPPEALKKIIELKRAGASVVLGSRRPTRAPGLTGYPACDEQVRAAAAELWGKTEAISQVRNPQSAIRNSSNLQSAILNLQSADFSGPAWKFTHRRDGETDIYFVAGSGAADCLFRVSGKEPELWDPLTGRTRDAVRYSQTPDGRTVVPLTLPENGAMFVIFRRPAESRRLTALSAQNIEIAGRAPGGNAAILHAWDAKPLELAGPWQVRFAPGWGAPESAVFDRLIPWNEHPEAGIKYFSGSAAYHKTFELTPEQARGLVRLDLGQVMNIACVKLNGKPLGTVWTAPWRADLTGAARPGKNELEIEVTNTWVNRLIGDASLPEDKRFTKTHARRPAGETGRYAHLKGYAADDPLRPAGLVGPVRLEFGQRQERPIPEGGKQ